ncbi:MAG TPA: L,D-transpeptidase [Mycobacteriales bacterium]|nr:L,D-transpeptidase [Mycobacteriales bacterium]
MSRSRIRVRAGSLAVAAAAALTAVLPMAAPAADAATAATAAKAATAKHPCGLSWTVPTLTAWGLFPRNQKTGYYVYAQPSKKSKKIFHAVDPAKSGTSGVLAGFDSTYTHQTGWFKVIVPDRSNKKLGWAKQTDLAGYKIKQWLEINTESHKMALIKGTTCVRVFPVAVGKASTATPHGYFFVNDRLAAPNAAYGHHILGTSAYSPAFVTFGGLDAAIGIHGTDEDSSVGHAVSHGCVRMHIGDSDWLYPRIKLGTPVFIN